MAKQRVQEAMEMASERICNKCKVRFEKASGCNHITCSGCGNEQCYLCSKDVKGYDHFGDGPGQCSMRDITKIADDVLEAKNRTIREILKNQPDLTLEDIDVEWDVSKWKSPKKRFLGRLVRPPNGGP